MTAIAPDELDAAVKALVAGSAVDRSRPFAARAGLLRHCADRKVHGTQALRP
jgi:hypothetical protein